MTSKMILPDYPIQSKDNDKLKRAPLAQKVADLILAFKGSESFVVGVEGAWGAGKHLLSIWFWKH